MNQFSSLFCVFIFGKMFLKHHKKNFRLYSFATTKKKKMKMEKFERFIIESMKRRVFDVFFKNDKKLSENRKKE